jgi:FkbM family methyltransferase
MGWGRGDGVCVTGREKDGALRMPSVRAASAGIPVRRRTILGTRPRTEALALRQTTSHTRRLPASAAEAVARAYSRRLLPARIASSLFWRLASHSEGRLAGRSVVTSVRFEDAVMHLRLPLDRRQNWTTIFGGFTRSGDAVMLAEFGRRCRSARGIVDAGANAGLYTYYAAAVASPSTVIIAAEPIVELVDLINYNLARNNMRNACAVNVAVSDDEGEVPFFVAASDQASSLYLDHVEAYGGPSGAARQMRTATIDRLVESGGMDHVDVVKIDVEGHELRALAGAVQTLHRHKPVLFLEAQRKNFEAARDMLSELGYTMKSFGLTRCAEVERGSHSDVLANYLCEVGD